MKNRMIVYPLFLGVFLSGCCLLPKEIVPCPALPYLCATPPRPQFSVWMLNASTNTTTCIVLHLDTHAGLFDMAKKHGSIIHGKEMKRGQVGFLTPCCVHTMKTSIILLPRATQSVRS